MIQPTHRTGLPGRAARLLAAAMVAAGMAWAVPGAATGQEWRLAQSGPSQDGTAQDGTAQDGAAQDGAAQDGAAEDGPAPAAPPSRDDRTDAATGGVGSPAADAMAAGLPEIRTDLSALPFAARRMHELLVEAARGGDIEKLRPYIGSGDDMTMLSFGGMAGDPIDFLKSTSGDAEGHEILAILLEILQAGHVHVEPGTPNEMYVWPYFYAMPLEKLTPAQRVELFTLMTYGDYEEMVNFGAYFFYRVGITPQGRWRFFVAGD